MVVAGDGKYLVTGGFDKKLKLWLVENDTCLQEKLSAHTDYIVSMMAATNSYVIYTGSADQKLKKWILKPDKFDENIHCIEQSHSFTSVDCVYSMSFSNREKY